MRASDFMNRHATTIAILVVTALAVAASIIFHFQNVSGNRTEAWLMHTYQTTGHIQLLSNRIKDVELGQSNYIATHDPQYLEPYYDALKDSLGQDAKSDQMEQHHSIAEEFNILRTLTEDNVLQQQNLDELDNDIQELKAHWRATVDNKGVNNPDDVQRAFALMTRTRNLISIMMAEENHLLSQRIADDSASNRQRDALTYSGIMLFYLIMVTAIFFYQRGREEADRTRQKLIAKLTDSNTELERFAYVASHDMQEPLRMMSSFGALLGEEYKGKLDADGQEYLGQITRSAKRMQDMVIDLLEYARISGEMPQHVTVDMDNELKHATDNLSAMLHDRRGKFSHAHLPQVRGNPVQLMRLLQNLIGNALKYQAPNVTPAVHVGVHDRPTEWEFYVRDNGIGIAPEHLQKIFEPFKRLHTWDEYTGTGIGLAVCRKIVESHNGKIWVTSEVGNGSLFHFTIPKSL